MMKICNIYIASFGKLHDVNVDITDNFTTFIKNNGEGKTTLFNFILAMFYGAGKNSQKDLRGLYLPWDEKIAFGSISFNHQNKNYKLERKFAKTAKGDESHLYDLDLGREITLESNYGEYFFNLDEEAFKSTLFVRQSLLMVNDNSSLNDLLINTINTGDASMSIDNANHRLNELDKTVNVNYRFSKAYALKNEEIQIQNELYELQNESKEANNLITSLEALENKKADLDDKMKLYDKIKDYNKSKSNYDLYLKYQELLNKKVEKKQPVIFDACLLELNNVYIMQPKKANIIYIILACLSLILGITLGILVNPYYYFILAGVLIFGITYGYFYKKYLNEKLKDEELKQTTYLKYNATNYQDALKNILEKQNESKEENEELVSFKKSHDINLIMTYKDFKINDEYETYSNVDDLINETNNKINEINHQIIFNKGILSKIDNSLKITKLIERKNYIEESLASYQRIYDQYKIAKSYIDEASDSIYHNFSPLLMKELKDVLNSLSGGKFKDLIIDSSLNISLDEGSSLHPLVFYSQGYKDMVYLALRIAIIKIVYKDEIIPIFLDDPLVNLDPNNKLLVVNYLKDLAKTYQIFYFSCTNLD